MWTSPDGINWSRASLGEAAQQQETTQKMTSVAATGSVIVAVGFVADSPSDSDAAVWVATANN